MGCTRDLLLQPINPPISQLSALVSLSLPRYLYLPDGMGLDWSAPPGRAEFPASLLPFTVWGKDDLRMLKKRHAESLGGKRQVGLEAVFLCLTLDFTYFPHIYSAETRFASGF